jgi:lanosterol synthase
MSGHRSSSTSFGWACQQYVVVPLFLYPTDLAKHLPNLPPAKTPPESARNGYEYFEHLQAHNGHWPGEYGWPTFLIPGLTIGSYVTEIAFTNEERLEMIRYLMNHANEDGGWEMYVSS